MRTIVALVVALICCAPARSEIPSTLDEAAHDAIAASPRDRREGLQWVLLNGDQGSASVLIQLLRWRPDDEGAIVARLRVLTGADAGPHWFDWMLWQQAHPDIRPFPGYDRFLADLLAGIDPAFRRFVQPGVAHDIRLEEVAWGGVRVDGIPALDNPAMVPAAAATWLNAADRVFGVEINGDVRAYPMRIAAWHEMVNDVVGGVPVSLAYCTLCGAGILFDGRVPGRDQPFSFGSSGLLYRSNKLMYDRQTDSLWNQFTGQAVMGHLAGQATTLTVLPVVLTSWAQWHERHPDTRVLSLRTGFTRDYGSGVAYHDYFASPDIMFPALLRDRRLAAKDLVFGVRLPGGVKAWPLSSFAHGAVLNDRVGFADVVLVGDSRGEGARAYRGNGHPFTRDSAGNIVSAGERWRVTEAALLGPAGAALPRVPGHVAYWFAWAGYFEDAQLGVAQ